MCVCVWPLSADSGQTDTTVIKNDVNYYYVFRKTSFQVSRVTHVGAIWSVPFQMCMRALEIRRRELSSSAWAV